jgi:hypothetical protein
LCFESLVLLSQAVPLLLWPCKALVLNRAVHWGALMHLKGPVKCHKDQM